MKYSILLIFVAFQAFAQSSVSNSPEDLRHICQKIQPYWKGPKKNEHVLPATHSKYARLGLHEACVKEVAKGGGLNEIKAMIDSLRQNCDKEPDGLSASQKISWTADGSNIMQARFCETAYIKTTAFLEGVNTMVPSPKCDFSPNTDRLKPAQKARVTSDAVNP